MPAAMAAPNNMANQAKLENSGFSSAVLLSLTAP